ncbi:MAG: Na+/H+ antiporter subunit E [Planctomycetota bacterium]|nr:MAG: Na+/H+ antiporter subunit E [Planctomycetota bacterium]
MTRFLMNLALAVVWCALWGVATAWMFIGGMLVGAGVISAYSRARGEEPYLGRGWELLRFAMGYVWLLTKANALVAWEVLTPRMHQSPRIIRYPVSGLSDAHRTTLANAITLTPGTLVVDVSPDDRWMYIHCMYARDRAKAVAEIDDLAERIRKGLFT